MSILLIHNDPLALSSLRRNIEKCYHRDSVATFSNAGEALMYIRSRPSDISLCFTEVKMNGASGMQVVKALRECGSKAKTVFVSNTNAYAMDAWRLGVRDYLLEPITLESVRHTLESCG